MTYEYCDKCHRLVVEDQQYQTQEDETICKECYEEEKLTLAGERSNL
jgi:formylmethanofuran dehydrogenase subunit E